MRATLVSALVGAAILTAASPWAAPTELVRFDNLAMQQVVARAFTLDREQEVEIGGVKLRRQYAKEPMAAWILDADTRAVVWELGPVREFRVRARTAHFATSARLPAGAYELYLATFPTRVEPEGFWGCLSGG